MTTLDTIRDAIPDFARDLKLNLGSVLTPAGAPGLSEKQIWGVALASALAARHLPSRVISKPSLHSIWMKMSAPRRMPPLPSWV